MSWVLRGHPGHTGASWERVLYAVGTPWTVCGVLQGHSHVGTAWGCAMGAAGTPQRQGDTPETHRGCCGDTPETWGHTEDLSWVLWGHPGDTGTTCECVLGAMGTPWTVSWVLQGQGNIGTAWGCAMRAVGTPWGHAMGAAGPQPCRDTLGHVPGDSLTASMAPRAIPRARSPGVPEGHRPLGHPPALTGAHKTPSSAPTPAPCGDTTGDIGGMTSATTAAPSCSGARIPRPPQPDAVTPQASP